jgi:hypothetical protein
MFLSPEQFSKMTDRDLAEVRAEMEAVDEAQAKERIRRSRTLVLGPREGAEVPVEFVGIGDFLDGPAQAEDLARLGVSPQLIERLRAWQKDWEARVETGRHPREFTSGQPLSLRLTRQFQSELPEHDVYLDVAGDLRAARDLSP